LTRAQVIEAQQEQNDEQNRLTKEQKEELDRAEVQLKTLKAVLETMRALVCSQNQTAEPCKVEGTIDCRSFAVAASCVEIEHDCDYTNEDYFEQNKVTDIKSTVVVICLRYDHQCNSDQRRGEPDGFSFVVPHLIC
jgi:hypothetical protein